MALFFIPHEDTNSFKMVFFLNTNCNLYRNQKATFRHSKTAVIVLWITTVT